MSGPTELGETPPRVVLYSKPGCHLCDDARAVVEAVCEELGETYDEIDITTSEELMRSYGEEIPVTFVDGRQHDFWRVDPARLRAALTGR
ncbi:glutaredoxin family protein [Nocardioides sp. WL0053]|jgi:glutaredoxin|uniref:Glutaredoxin family protein n=1 Tax=Nocardioides jiangsuensis TaxID=2866161 RepID=A0ABS7RLX6_9ACTN|nr:glutaredoxin family protein [Nocardioides jiangsuensis]MBY9074542.1 glutaredoxin family protein [Nocardioides jiangsuensis]